MIHDHPTDNTAARHSPCDAREFSNKQGISNCLVFDILPNHLMKSASLIFLTLFFAVSAELVLKVGIILEGSNPGQEDAFRNGIFKANENLAELQLNSMQQIKLEPVIKHISTGNAFAASRSACELLTEQVIAIFGPDSTAASTQALWVSHRHKIPYMLAQWDLNQPNQLNYTINLHPHYDNVGKALENFLREAEDWRQLGLIYAHDDSLQKYESLLTNFKGEVVMRKWDNTALNHKYVIKYFRTTLSQFRFVVDIPRSEIEGFLELIAEYNMTSQYYSYFFTDWDTQFLDPKVFAVDRGANFSAISLFPLMGLNINNPHEGTESLGNYGQKSPSNIFTDDETPPSARDSLTYYLLIMDTLNLLSLGISRLASTTQIIPPTGFTCDSAESWPLGPELLAKIKSVSLDDNIGNTGGVEFGENGRRKNIKLTILELKKDGFQNYGYWNERDNLVVTKNFNETQREIQQELKGQTLRVVVIEDKPFIMYKGKVSPTGKRSSDPNDWHGFCIDLLNKCAEQLEFNFTVYIPDDNSYGSANFINDIEIWDGVIGELQTRRADMAALSLTINYERERIIDFTTPFMNLGVSIIFKKPVGKQPDLFSFLRPLSPPVWGYVLIAYVCVSMALFFVARFSPYEWHNPHPCNSDSELLENNFNMLNSLWFTIGSLMQQGSDILPRATSTRIIAGFWWFFTLIIISSYTANLAAFLTVERMKAPINDAYDLAKQTKIKYGCREGGTSAAFFEKSNISAYNRMWKFMSTHKGVMMNNTEEAIARVKRGGYAYILESTMNEYYTQRDCDLMQVGHNLDSKGYGIGFPQGSKYRDSMSEVILQLQKSQALEEMRRYWWRNFSITQFCDDGNKKTADMTSLGLEQVGGCFVMILIGLGSSIFISLSEFLYKAFQRSKVTKRSFSEEVAREFRFSMARSNTRDFGAESVLNLPPPPSRCIPSSKESRMAALAYAPCLPAAVKITDKDTHTPAAMSCRRPSAFDVTRLHRRVSTRRSRSSQLNCDLAHPHSNASVHEKTDFNTKGPSDSTRPLLPPYPSSCSAFAINDSPSDLAAFNFSPQQIVLPPPLPASSSFADRLSSHEFDEPPMDPKYSQGPPYASTTYIGSHGDIRLKKYQC